MTIVLLVLAVLATVAVGLLVLAVGTYLAFDVVPARWAGVVGVTIYLGVACVAVGGALLTRIWLT